MRDLVACRDLCDRDGTCALLKSEICDIIDYLAVCTVSWFAVTVYICVCFTCICLFLVKAVFVLFVFYFFLILCV